MRRGSPSHLVRSGTGNGTVGFSAAVNIAGSRSGTLTIAGQTFSVTQAGAVGPVEPLVAAAIPRHQSIRKSYPTCEHRDARPLELLRSIPEVLVSIGWNALCSDEPPLSMLLRPVVKRIVLIVLVAAGVCGCETSSTLSQGPNPVKCLVTLASPPLMDAGGGSGSLAITTQPECAWEVSSTASWISGFTPPSGQGQWHRVVPRDVERRLIDARRDDRRERRAGARVPARALPLRPRTGEPERERESVVPAASTS